MCKEAHQHIKKGFFPLPPPSLLPHSFQICIYCSDNSHGPICVTNAWSVDFKYVMNDTNDNGRVADAGGGAGGGGGRRSGGGHGGEEG